MVGTRAHWSRRMCRERCAAGAIKGDTGRVWAAKSGPVGSSIGILTTNRTTLLPTSAGLPFPFGLPFVGLVGLASSERRFGFGFGFGFGLLPRVSPLLLYVAHYSSDSAVVAISALLIG